LVFRGTKAQQQQEGDGGTGDQQPIHDVKGSDVQG
jgi:hypothetical protein